MQMDNSFYFYVLVTFLAIVGLLCCVLLLAVLNKSTVVVLLPRSFAVGIWMLSCTIMPFQFLRLSSYEAIVLLSLMYFGIDHSMQTASIRLQLLVGDYSETSLTMVSESEQIIALVETGVLGCVYYGTYTIRC